MNHKEQVDNLKNNAELAWASYFKFDLIGEKFKDEEEYKDKRNKPITHTDILNLTYNGYKTENSTFFNTQKLNGDMSPNQAQRFFERYELLFHQPNTDSGFSATLFKDLGELDKVTRKRKSVDSNEQFILSIRGSEMGSDKLKEVFNDFYADFLLATNKIPKQYFELIDCIETKIKPRIYNEISGSYSKMTIVGHSLGGFLAQMCALSYDELINEIYTYNAPGIFNDTPAKILNNTKISAIAIAPSLYGIKKFADYIVALFKSNTNIESYQMLDMGNKGKLYCGMLEMNETLFKCIANNNSRGLLEIINKDDNITQQLKYTIPYFLRIDQEEITLEVSKYTYTRKIFYPNSMREYAKKLYDILEENIKIYKDKTFYVYYAYAFIHTTTQAQISESNLIVLSYDLNIPYGNLINQFQSLRKESYYKDKTLEKRQCFHIISQDISGGYDVIGNLGIKIPAHNLAIQIGLDGIIDKHSIIPLTQTLYFHSYLLESSINDSIFQNNIHDILNALNSIVKSIYNILYNIEINKALQEGDYDDNNPISVNNPPHWLYATIDKTLFEATSKTNDNKKLIKNDASDVIDGILYLQDNEIYIKILSKNEIINININSPLANLFALHEAIFFTSVDKAGKPLISNNEIANKLIGYITPRTQIFCNNLKENSKDVIIKCYINKTLEYYPESIK
ncbi:hypothetical protein DCO58_05820 [Helicobacter saguini]|uniref:Fungal lipase-type domain-containing protein n=2 Tax=Helicobacter saguini TaxID=1548018 RepID=A0A6L7D5T3_9HELI|nr:hypothetical protein [Helicobacter saguini]MWV62136.1 hypothetical protein [Helicobacter saguini]MWV67192.1 hypothetical protein [Helicobacter saguini]MWV69544.1 hypothetical protein [Helicobacter saguini]